MTFMKRFDRYEVCATLSSIFFAVLSTSMVVYAIVLKSQPYVNPELLRFSNVQECLDELNCQDLSTCSPKDIVQHCLGAQLPNQYNRQIPGAWFTNNSNKPFLTQIVETVMAEEYKNSEEGLSTHKAYLLGVKKVIHSATSYFLQWFLNEPAATDGNGWRPVRKFVNLDAIYTVSPGPENASNGSTIVATEDGVYHIYAKITFKCTRADNEAKRVALRVLVEEPSGDAPKEILVASETAHCYVIGDLVTLYQGGHVFLPNGSKLYLEYLTSSGVPISTGRHRAYKSFFGVYKATY